MMYSMYIIIGMNKLDKSKCNPLAFGEGIAFCDRDVSKFRKNLVQGVSLQAGSMSLCFCTCAG